jgi:dipeptidyl aminopeptidase/acylaminoacyl peptidase
MPLDPQLAGIEGGRMQAASDQARARMLAGALYLIALAGVMGSGGIVAAQGTIADYQRAMSLRDRYDKLVPGIPDLPRFIEKTNRFYYRRTVKGGHEFVLVDAATGERRPAFDHEKLAASLAAALNRPITAIDLPFTIFTFAEGERAIEFTVAQPDTPPPAGPQFRCSLDGYTCRGQEATGGRGGRGGRGGGGLAGPVRPPFEINGGEAKKSPDGKLEALVRNFNVAVRETGKDDLTVLSTDGSEGGYYDLDSLVWSPDSTKIAVYKVRPGYRRYVNYVQSSPEDQLQPRHSTMQYAKPGDVLDVELPVLFHVGSRTQQHVDNALFPNAYDMSSLEWRKDSRAVTLEYNQRGHQVYRVIEIDAADGKIRVVISEEPKTFFTYSGKKYRFDLGDGREVVWMSERDGWNHLYLFDGTTGDVKRQITKGEWAVRGVQKVDEEKKQILFSASGRDPGKDPYFVQYYRINLDGTGLTALTTTDANHTVTYSPDFTYYVDTYSRTDMAPVTELRRTGDGSLVTTLEKADAAELVKAGWRPPEPFVAKGRDGKTDIYGVIFRPTNFDPSKKYPVIENIYAGPHGAFVPKSFGAYNQMQAQAEVGFVVVQIDGMGTNFRSKAFHDVAWQNLKDAGFPDRILWHKAVAAKYPWYDITRVGIYGTSAGGQSSLGGLLFHPEFYKVAVSSVGCHDNRMDKIWWNEQWMGWPIGPHYSESSNVDNAYRLQGRVLLVVGELDRNVDPSSTMQVANQLIKHNKDFDLLVIPGAGHGPGGAYGEHKRFDYFVRHLLGVNPPEWKALDEVLKKSRGTTPSSM